MRSPPSPAPRCGRACIRRSRRWPTGRRCGWMPGRWLASSTVSPSTSRRPGPAPLRWCACTPRMAGWSAWGKCSRAVGPARCECSMRIVQGLDAVPPDSPPSVVALGTFDGVHLGHRAILGTALTRAREAGLEAVACTFDPHPMEVLQPERAPRPISPLAERLAVIGETGIDTVVVLPFTRQLAAIEPEAFVKDALLDRLHAREIVVGYNHRFGRGARGDARLLESLADRLGFRAHVVP